MFLTRLVYAICIFYQIIFTEGCSPSSTNIDINGFNRDVSVVINGVRFVPSNPKRFSYSKKNEDDSDQEKQEYEAEKLAGDPADVFGANSHHRYLPVYSNLSRRFMPFYLNREELMREETKLFS